MHCIYLRYAAGGFCGPADGRRGTRYRGRIGDLPASRTIAVALILFYTHLELHLELRRFCSVSYGRSVGPRTHNNLFYQGRVGFSHGPTHSNLSLPASWFCPSCPVLPCPALPCAVWSDLSRHPPPPVWFLLSLEFPPRPATSVPSTRCPPRPDRRPDRRPT